jgi:hypothetical protein
LLQTTVLVFQLFEPPNFGDPQPAILLLLKRAIELDPSFGPAQDNSYI